ncbi:MAG: hypothetical protein LW809_05465 [Vampirovibrionales bacterium]|jgi:hypothetical protein|nr:hypothetical protein [Vampirovibrionales bacterium]
MVRQTLKNTYHTSSLYLLKFLAFLEVNALKRAELQALFEQDTDCLSPLSTDTLRLYANALEEMGCLLQRPDKSNDFQYKLEYSPFWIQFSIEEWHLLLHSLDSKLQTSHIPSFVRVYEMAEHLLSQKFLTPQAKQELQNLLNRYIQPYQLKNLKLLERSTELNAWFLVQYQGKESVYEWQVLHDTIILDNRRLYSLCYHIHPVTKEISPLMLRLDRCRNLFPISQGKLGNYEVTRRRILHYIDQEPELCCAIVLPKGINFVSPRLRGERILSLTQETSDSLPFLEDIQAFYGVETYAIQYMVKTTHLFYLMQCLKASGGFLIPLSVAFTEAFASNLEKVKPQTLQVKHDERAIKL